MTKYNENDLVTHESRELASIYRAIRWELTNQDVMMNDPMRRVETGTVNESLVKNLVQRFTTTKIRDTATYMMYRGHDLLILSVGENNEDRRMTKLNIVGPSTRYPYYRGQLTTYQVTKDKFLQEIQQVISLIAGFHRYVQKLTYNDEVSSQ